MSLDFQSELMDCFLVTSSLVLTRRSLFFILYAAGQLPVWISCPVFMVSRQTAGVLDLRSETNQRL